jgi:hypothetical protein
MGFDCVNDEFPKSDSTTTFNWKFEKGLLDLLEEDSFGRFLQLDLNPFRSFNIHRRAIPVDQLHVLAHRVKLSITAHFNVGEILGSSAFLELLVVKEIITIGHL